MDAEGKDKLPELHQGVLDRATIEQLFVDWAQCTEVTDVIPKYAAQAYVGENQRVTLDAGRELILSGAVRALQVRYRYEDAEWWDTIMVLPEGGYRLVRIRHEF